MTSSEIVEPHDVGYFQRSLPVYLILGSFFALTIPLCFLSGGDGEYAFHLSIGMLYVYALGMTHFVITLVIYFQAANLRHFASTWSNRVTYFVLPAVILIFFDLYYALGIAVAVPTFDLFLRYGIRLMDFQHSTRQSYGMLQLFRMRSGCPFPAWMKRAENHYFTGVSLLLFVTFLTAGKFRPDRPVPLIVLGIVVCLFIWTLAGFVVAWTRTDTRAALLAPLAYFLLQTMAAGLAIYSTALYAFALAMHYVEYHVLMLPRCFDTPLERQSRTDRCFGWLRQRKIVFYGLILLLAAPVMQFAWLGMSTLLRAPDSSLNVFSRMAIAVFDGLFVCHYLIESRIWKFGDPYYRRALLPLYFRSTAPAAKRVSDPTVALDAHQHESHSLAASSGRG